MLQTITAYEDGDSNFLSRSVFFVSKGNLFYVYCLSGLE